jgi:hypothetical protein
METSGRLSPFELRIGQAGRRIGKVEAALDEVGAHAFRGDMEGAYEAAFELADQAERLALIARDLPACTGHPRAREMMEGAMLESIPISIGFTGEGWFCARLPALLPRKGKGSPAWLTDPLHQAMSRFFRGKEPVRYPCSVAVFRHVYSRDRPERQYRDHDNIELNRVMDIVALYVMADDSPMGCRHYYCSAPGTGDRTEVYVVPRDGFARWLSLEGSIPEGGAMLHGMPP